VLVFAVYWGVGRSRVQNVVLLIGSYVFYAFWDYRFCVLLLATSLVDYAVGRGLGATNVSPRRKLLLAASLFVDLGILGTFKYFDFFSQSLARAMHLVGFQADFVTLNLLLPVGISFYTFKSLSYTIDVYRGRCDVTRSAIDYLTFVAFFPQLLAGPIDRASAFLPQLRAERTFEYAAATDAGRQILWGLFKKMAVADGLAVIVSDRFDHFARFQGPELALAAFLFTVQIYCDFSAYSDISIGVARLFGISAMRNFAYPYFSQSVAEFWRRWHISLSTWFRDYVYIPLGGSRVGRGRHAANLFATFLLSGLWHGAAMNFVFWGGLHGLGVMPTALRKGGKRLKATDTPGGEHPGVAAIGRILVTFVFVSFAWIFFRASSLHVAVSIIRRILSPPVGSVAWMAPLHTLRAAGLLPYAVVALFVIDWIQRRKPHGLDMPSVPRPARWIIYTTTMWITLLLMTPQTGQFLYFRF
jgi:D-alanyl-lipoteichoic acid acyltransferase DltB (MBOAT superfamily)